MKRVLGGLRIALTIALLDGCRSHSAPRSDAVQADAADVPAPHAREACTKIVVAVVREPIDALAVAASTIYAVSRARGDVLAIAKTSRAGASDPDASARTFGGPSREPFAIVVRGDRPAWATGEGVFGADADGAHPRALLRNDTVSALAAGPRGVYAATRVPDAIWRIDWPQVTSAEIVVRDASASELVATASALAWIRRDVRGVATYDLDTHATRTLARDQRKPHDLSAAAGALLWHEGEADLAPGRDPSAFQADLRSGTVTSAVGAYDSSNRYLVRSPYIYGAGVCKRSEDATFRRIDSGEGQPPITDDDKRVYWIEDRHDGQWRIVAIDKDLCCH